MKTKQFLITLLMCCVSISMSAAEWTDANGTVWNFSTSGSNATILKGFEKVAISGTIPADLTIPSKVYIGETEYSVTSIGQYAFYYCTSVTSITIPNGVKYIESAAFWGCLGLTSINIPESVESIGNYAFSNTGGIRSLYIKDLKKYLQISFGNNSSPVLCSTTNTVELYVNNVPVTTVIIPEGVTNIPSYAFRNCSNLTSINIPESVESIGQYAFFGCSNLTSINIPESVESIGQYAFSNCSNLTSINIPESVESIGQDAFRNCI